MADDYIVAGKRRTKKDLKRKMKQRVYKKGGATETVLPGITGEFFEDQTWEDLANTIIHFHPEKYDPQKIRQHALQFSKERFQKEIKQFIKNIIEEK